MAEAVAALATVGTVSSILQIVDFSAKVASLTWDISHSSDGTVKDNVRIEALVNQHKTLAGSVVTPKPARQVLTQDEAAVDSLAQSCKDEAKALLDLLQSLKVPSTSRGLERAWMGIKQASRALRKEKDIESKRKILHELNGQLTIALLQNLRYGAYVLARSAAHHSNCASSSLEAAHRCMYALLTLV